MNLILLNQQDYIDDKRVRLSGRRFKHLHSVLNVASGDSLRVGKINDQIGTAKVVSVSKSHIELIVDLTVLPADPLGIDIIVALPRPLMFKRILYTATMMGVKKMHFIHSRRVEKSFWQSSSLKEEEIEQQCILALEQAGDTIMPEIHFHRRFKPFIEDKLPGISKGKQKILAHADVESVNPALTIPAVAVIGPEGGFSEYEVDVLCQQGFQLLNLGRRILRVDTAVTTVLAKFV